jgi:hypothetical protein
VINSSGSNSLKTEGFEEDAEVTRLATAGWEGMSKYSVSTISRSGSKSSMVVGGESVVGSIGLD